MSLYNFMIDKQILKNECKHEDKSNCCCSKQIKKVALAIETDRINCDDARLVDNNFVSQYTNKNEILWFCNLCRRYGSNNSGKQFKNGGDWILKGVYFKDMEIRKSDYMNKYLLSNMHQVSIKH